ncbi:NB-ARC domain-containing protein [Streptomyces zhaozhouensis]|uniref:NB-ARC domain-containing protein n=1 Tax=Streptomyces zhaozhouensis TaxID=1300267 RepID=A0A286E057_9ACTN|nr:tetratricopeptide repeat protein [Streptomyces zhaozhouensis]SOD64292.1 NB-ARC domain-containing protein [Streptomyces zhaozhouensis]
MTEGDQDPAGRPTDGSHAALSGSARDVVQAGSVSGGIHFHTGADPGEAARPRQLPGDTRGFVNRVSEMEHLDAVLGVPDPGISAVVLVVGTAGVGKTSLALRWAHRVADRFPDGQLYVNLRGYDPAAPLTPGEVLHHFLTALGVPPAAVPADPDAAAALYRTRLANRRVLILLDNVATAAQVRPLLPGGPGCLTLVTSRSRVSGLTVRDGAHRLVLDVLPEAEAVALLRAFTGGRRDGADQRDLVELAGLCARLPLALRIAAERAASNPYARLPDLIAELRDESSLWDALSTGEGPDAEAVRTVFAWSYRALPEGAARLFRLLGVHPGPEFRLQAASALCGAPVARTRQLLDSLVSAHLLTQTAPDRFEFHDLLRAYAGDQARLDEPEEERRAALHRVLSWYLRSADAAHRLLAPGDDRLPLDGGAAPEVAPHAIADHDQARDWAEREHTNVLAAARAAARAELHAFCWQLAVAQWRCWTRAAPAAGWLDVAALALASSRALDDRAAEARVLRCLGDAHAQRGDLSASREHHRAALALHRASGDRLAEGRALNALGLTGLRGRQLPQAIADFEEAEGIFRILAEGEDPAAARQLAATLTNLANAYHEAGRLDDAEAVVAPTLADHRRQGNERGEGAALRVLSDIQRERGDTAAALRSARRSVDLALTARSRPSEGYRLLTLGAAQRAAGQLDEALASYQRAAALYRRLGDRANEARAWHGAGEAFHGLGRDDQAAAFHRRAADVFVALDDPWWQALARDGLARALLAEDPPAAAAQRRTALRLLASFDDARARALRGTLDR